ncbi:DoxX family protein [Halonotius roseus]|uniref:DoxX family protein n=1 Tax=Halonotius roseus TaxID=2511997 RepID=A0A544QMI5_9EURY|nr:DoxX family protein [Halonotius roseus]TQQ80122.1 DoxX family protein [Halonotius roseus]
MLPTTVSELLVSTLPLQAGFDGALTGELFLLGRLLFGGVLAFNGLNHFLDAESMAGYAGAKGVPAPGLAVPVTGGILLFGGLGVAAGVLPTLAAGALVVFLVATTPVMHNFWAVPEEQKQGEMINFLKNVAMTGAALALLAISTTAWPYALA